MRRLILFFFVILICISNTFCQDNDIFPVTINEKMPELSFVTGDNRSVKIDGTSGKKTMLVFIRGKVTPTVWCPICHYQYLELLELDAKEQLRKKHNMDIYFVLPYKTDSLQNWIDAFPKSLTSIDGWKNPPNQENMAANVKEWMEYAREFFPYSFKFDKEKFKMDIPVLFDPDRKVSNGLMIFKEEWGGTKVPQNIPTIYILDEKGFTKFKYQSQYTNDRPDAVFLKKFMEKML